MLFIAMLALQKDPSRALSVESALRDQFENVDQAVNENWLDVSNFEELGDWIVVAIDNLHIANMFQSWGETKLVSEKRGSKVATAQRGQISSFNNVISGLALIQTRGTVVDCEPQSSRTVGGYLPTYAPYCYTNTPTTESYGPPPTCKTAAEIARKTTGTRAGGDFFLHCLEDGVDVFDYTNATDYATPHAKKYKYSSVSQGYIEIIDLGSFGSSKDEANAQWAELVEDSWLDKQSREMMIVIMTYNANTGLYGIGTLSFQLNVGGVFKRKLAVESYVISNQYRHYWDFIRLAIEILFFGWTGISTLNEFKQMRHHGCADYWSSEGGIWNVIDWLATIALMCNLALWTTISVLTALWVMPGRSASLGDTAYESVESIFVEYSAGTTSCVCVVCGSIVPASSPFSHHSCDCSHHCSLFRPSFLFFVFVVVFARSQPSVPILWRDQRHLASLHDHSPAEEPQLPSEARDRLEDDRQRCGGFDSLQCCFCRCRVCLFLHGYGYRWPPGARVGQPHSQPAAVSHTMLSLTDYSLTHPLSNS